MTPDEFGTSIAALFDLPSRLSAIEAEMRELRRLLVVIRRQLPPALASVPDTARVLGVSVSTVRRHIKNGALPVVRVGSAVRVDLTACVGDAEHRVDQLAREARRGANGRSR